VTFYKTFLQDSISIFQSSLKREIRYSKFDIVAKNSSFVTVNGSSIKQYYDKQILDVHIDFHKNITEFHASIKLNQIFYNNKCNGKYMQEIYIYFLTYLFVIKLNLVND